MTILSETILCPYCNVHSTISNRARYNQWSIYTCDHCNLPLLVIRQVGEIIDQYPKRTPKLDESIPQEVADDYIEAIKCFDSKADKASVIMCGRALQSSVIERGATNKRLMDQIDDLYANAIITRSIRDWAHEIRLSRNIGAHPDKDGLKDVTSKDAKEIIEFMEEYLNYVYIMPDRVQKKRQSSTT